MDYKLPRQLFPCFYKSGPPDNQIAHECGGWGSFEQLLETNYASSEGGNQSCTRLKFEPKYRLDGEIWSQVEPIVTPLLPPVKAKILSGLKGNPKNIPWHMKHFYEDNYRDAFSTMSRLIGEEFNFKKKNGINMHQMMDFVSDLKNVRCPVTYQRQRVTRYYNMLGDLLGDIPPALLAECLREDLVMQQEWESSAFQDTATGGALACLPLTEGPSGRTECCLVYPRDAALNTLNFHKVALHCRESPSLDLGDKPASFTLNGTIRQISAGRMESSANVGVRSDHFCGVWKVGDRVKPKVLEVIQTKEPSTCLTVSPHVPEELLVTSESGAAHLWTVGKGLRLIRKEDSNLYFNCKSSWRWCEFSAHPRVMVYADRSGAELTDSRDRGLNHTLFRIGKASECRNGERVNVTKYLSEIHSYHHLIATQYSVYLVDERVPCVPMLKWDHMMKSPTTFIHCTQWKGSTEGTCKILLGSQFSQELMMLQYSGGRERACQSRGPPELLSAPRESLSKLPVQLPFRQCAAEQRLRLPATGLAAIQRENHLCVFHLTDAGDLFYQMLKRHWEETTEQPDSAHSLAAAEEDANNRGQNAVTTELPSVVQKSPDPRNPALQGQLETATDYGGAYSDFVKSEATVSSFNSVKRPRDLFSQSVEVCTKRPTWPVGPEKASDEVLAKWKKWLAVLYKKTPTKNHLPHHSLKTAFLVHCDDVSLGETLRKDHVQSLREDLKAAMRRKEAVVQTMDVTPVPDAADLSAWTDDLSQRLSASWNDGWRSWWAEKLGMNREKKMEALRQKRQLQKRSRARRRISLSGSFTSSKGTQNIDLSGLSSATSQDGLSDGESVGTTLGTFDDNGPFTPRSLINDMEHSIATPTMIRNSSSKLGIRKPMDSRERVRDRVSSWIDAQVTEDSYAGSDKSQLFGAKTNDTPAAILKPASQKRPQQDDLSSLFGSQEPCGSMTPPLSEQTGFTPSQTGPNVRLLSSQLSRPQRKKFRMGF